jgi:hypothetical protein
MRLASVSGIVALALTGAACRTSPVHTAGDKDLAAKLRELGIEGKTYANDLSQVASVAVTKVYPIDDDLLIEDLHGHLTYIEGATLNPRWEFYGMPRGFDRRPDSTPSAIIGLAGGKLFVLTRNNGTTVVEPRRIDIVASGAPVATDSTLYVPTFPTPSTSKTIQSVSIGSGYMGWGWRTSSDIVGGMAKGGPGAGDTFYVATSDGRVIAFPTYETTERDPEIGWETNLNGAITSDLSIDRDDIAVVMTDGRLVLVDRIAGSPRWEAYASGNERAEGSASFSAKHVFYRCGGELRAFDRATGAKAWAVRGASAFVAERGGRMLLSTTDGRLLSVDKTNGKVLASMNAGGWTFPRRASADTTIFAISRTGTLVAVEFGF